MRCSAEPATFNIHKSTDKTAAATRQQTPNRANRTLTNSKRRLSRRNSELFFVVWRPESTSSSCCLRNLNLSRRGFTLAEVCDPPDASCFCIGYRTDTSRCRLTAALSSNTCSELENYVLSENLCEKQINTFEKTKRIRFSLIIYEFI